MWVAMNKAWDEDLLGESSDKMVHNILFTEVVWPHLIVVCYFEPIDPLWDHNSFPCKLVNNLRHVKFSPILINTNLLSF